MSLAGAMNTLAAKVVTGITMRDLHQVPVPMATADLPLMFPVFEERVVDGRFTPQGFTASDGELVFMFEHTCFMDAWGLGRGTQKYQDAETLVDAYFTALVQDPDLGGNLARRWTVERVAIGGVYWNNQMYFGFSARHRWVVKY